MFAGSSCTLGRSPTRSLGKIMSKRKLTRSCSVGGSPCYTTKSPRIDHFYKSTKGASPRSTKAPRRKTITSPATDIRKLLSPSGDRTVKKRLMPKRRVNLSQIFEHVDHVVCHVEERPEKRPLEEVPSTIYPPAKLSKIDGDSELLVHEESRFVRSLVSNRIDPDPTDDPLVPPPPCIKRRWKSIPVRRGGGVKLFESGGPRTDTAISLACRKLQFGSPSAPEIRTIS